MYPVSILPPVNNIVSVLFYISLNVSKSLYGKNSCLSRLNKSFVVPAGGLLGSQFFLQALNCMQVSINAKSKTE